jgi:hypothetical protein
MDSGSQGPAGGSGEDVERGVTLAYFGARYFVTSPRWDICSPTEPTTLLRMPMILDLFRFIPVRTWHLVLLFLMRTVLLIPVLALLTVGLRWSGVV